MKSRTGFKILPLTNKALNDQAPSFFKELKLPYGPAGALQTYFCNVDNCTIYMSSFTAHDLNQELNVELKSMVEWIKNNRLVLNVSKTNGMVLGSNHSLSFIPVLNICINNALVTKCMRPASWVLFWTGNSHGQITYTRKTAKMAYDISVGPKPHSLSLSDKRERPTCKVKSLIRNKETNKQRTAAKTIGSPKNHT